METPTYKKIIIIALGILAVVGFLYGLSIDVGHDSDAIIQPGDWQSPGN